MNAELRKRCAELRRLFASATSDEIRTRHRIARIVLGVQQSANKYGARGVDKLALSLGCDRATLYRHAQVARRYDRAAIDDLLRRSSRSASSTITWSHLILLATVKNDAARSRLLEQTLRGLSVRELERLIREEEEASDGPGTRTASVLRRLLSATETLTARARVEIDVETPTYEIVELVGRVIAAQDELKAACDESARKLRELRSVLEPKLPGRRRSALAG